VKSLSAGFQVVYLKKNGIEYHLKVSCVCKLQDKSTNQYLQKN